MRNVDRPPHALRRTYRLLRAIGIGALVLLLVGVAAHLAASAICGYALARELAALRASGAPMTPGEAAPPPVTPAQNAAVVYQRAFQRVPEAGRQISRAVPRSWRNWPSSLPLDEARKIAAEYADAIKLARQAAAMPKCHFPVDWNAGVGALFPHYGKLRVLCRLLAVDAMVAAADARPSDAMADVGAIAGIARHTIMEPLLISQLNGYACLSIGHSTLEQVLRLCSPSEADCAALHRRLAQLDLGDAMSRAIQGERAFGLWAFGELRSRPDTLGALANYADGTWQSDGTPSVSPWVAGVISVVWSPVLCADERAYLRTMAALYELVRLPTPADRRRRSTELTPPNYAVLTKMLIPAFVKSADSRDEAMARLAVDRWALALHVYKLHAGRYPSSLDDVRRTVRWALPSDPMTGRDLAYKPLGNGYLLYSLGLNGKDDGGQGRSQRRRPAIGGDTRDDIAWRQAR